MGNTAFLREKGILKKRCYGYVPSSIDYKPHPEQRVFHTADLTQTYCSECQRARDADMRAQEAERMNIILPEQQVSEDFHRKPTERPPSPSRLAEGLNKPN